MTNEQIDRLIEQVAEATAPIPTGDCDTCGKRKPLRELHFLILYGMDTYACKECRHDDEPDSGE